jgi:hypothetical protein
MCELVSMLGIQMITKKSNDFQIFVFKQLDQFYEDLSDLK